MIKIGKSKKKKKKKKKSSGTLTGEYIVNFLKSTSWSIFSSINNCLPWLTHATNQTMVEPETSHADPTMACTLYHHATLSK